MLRIWRSSSSLARSPVCSRNSIFVSQSVSQQPWHIIAAHWQPSHAHLFFLQDLDLLHKNGVLLHSSSGIIVEVAAAEAMC
jgi:hypothetical protein